MTEDPRPETDGAISTPWRIAGTVCALESLVLVGIVVLYVIETARGESQTLMSALASGVLILLAALGTGALARGWFRGRDWARTPTIVWHVLFVPVAISMATSGQPVYAALIGLAVVLGGGAALAAAEPAAEED